MTFDQRVDEMPGKIDGALEGRNLAPAPALVDRLIAFRDTDGKGRHPIEEKRNCRDR